MLYHAVRVVHRGYALTLFWVYVGLFLLAFCLMFVLPLATIALLFLAIFGLAGAYLGKLVLELCENGLARRAFRRQACPNCQGSLDEPVPDASSRTKTAPPRVCIHCGTHFEACGAVIEDPQEHTPPLAASSA